jgi:hypothetical protein
VNRHQKDECILLLTAGHVTTVDQFTNQRGGGRVTVAALASTLQQEIVSCA